MNRYQVCILIIAIIVSFLLLIYPPKEDCLDFTTSPPTIIHNWPPPVDTGKQVAVLFGIWFIAIGLMVGVKD